MPLYSISNLETSWRRCGFNSTLQLCRVGTSKMLRVADANQNCATSAAWTLWSEILLTYKNKYNKQHWIYVEILSLQDMPLLFEYLYPPSPMLPMHVTRNIGCLLVAISFSLSLWADQIIINTFPEQSAGNWARPSHVVVIQRKNKSNFHWQLVGETAARWAPSALLFLIILTNALWHRWHISTWFRHKQALTAQRCNKIVRALFSGSAKMVPLNWKRWLQHMPC